MKHHSVALLLVAVFLAGCSKSEEETKLESALNEEVMRLLEEQKAGLSRIDDLLVRVDASTMRFDSLVVANPKGVAGHSAKDLVNARSRLVNTKSNIEAWLKAYNPYNALTPHEAAVAKLELDKEDLQNSKQNIDGAINEATAALTSHDKLVERLKLKSRGRKS